MNMNIYIGNQDFESIRTQQCFYIDKTGFIKEWWENKDSVTVINRPRRFGKTLNMSMLNCFFSTTYQNRGDLFEGLSIWNEEKYRKFQGTYTVLSVTFANVKERNYKQTMEMICQILTNLYNKHIFLLEGDLLTEEEKRFFLNVNSTINETTAAMAIYNLSDYLSRYYNKKVILLLDEYDTPMQEAYINGFWDEMAGLDLQRKRFLWRWKTPVWETRNRR